MASEWARKSAQGIVRPLKDRIYREMSARDYDEAWDRIAEALDAARIEGLEEAAKIVDEWLISGKCGISEMIRARIEEIKV